MHTVQIYLEETLDANGVEDLRQSLLNMEHVGNVVVNARDPHDMLIDYEEAYITPLDLVGSMNNLGLHPDIISG